MNNKIKRTERNELKVFIDVMPDQSLQAIKPLLKYLAENK